MLYSILICAFNTQGKGFITKGHEDIAGVMEMFFFWIVIVVIGPYTFVKID